MCRPPKPAAINQCPHDAGAAKAMTPIAMKQSPISGTTRTEKAPPDAAAVPYSSRQHPGSRVINPIVANTGVSTMPATSGGAYASEKRYAGAAGDSGAPMRRAFIVIAASAIAAATAASASQISTQRSELSGGPEMAAVIIAVTPNRTPPHPGMAVNSVARDIASRMNWMFSIACAWIGSGCALIKDFIAQRAGGAGG